MKRADFDKLIGGASAACRALNGEAIAPPQRREKQPEPGETTDEARLNRWEQDWLIHLRSTYPDRVIGVQNMTLKLGHDCRYTPDFTMVEQTGATGVYVTVYEVKGWKRDDAMVKLRVAARQFSWMIFILVERKDGAWFETRVHP